MSNIVYGDQVNGGRQYKQTGAGSVMNNTDSGGVSQAELDVAITELRTFIGQLTRDGVVGANGSIKDPAAVVARVRSHPDRFTALGRALAGGAGEGILSAMRSGVAALVVALVSGA